MIVECVNWYQQEGDPGKRRIELIGLMAALSTLSCILSVGDTNKVNKIDEPHVYYMIAGPVTAATLGTIIVI